MIGRRFYGVLAASATFLLTAMVSFAAFGGATIPGQDIAKIYTVNSDISMLGSDLVGDSINLNSGELSFREVDVSIPGNSDLPVEFARTFKTEMSQAQAWRRDELGNWRIDVPKITSVLKAPDYNHPTPSGYWPADRCSNMQDPGPVQGTDNLDSTFESYDYWNGVNAHIPGQGTQELLMPWGGNYPTMANAKLVTNNYWMVTCLYSPSNAGGQNDHAGNPGATPGEGFEIHTPDGLTYYFDRMKLVWAQPLTEPGFLKSLLLRRQYEMLASRVEDQYGNWVDYNYTPDSNGVDQLTSITSSDGREIDISYNAAYDPGSATVNTVTANGKTWKYVYSNPPNNTDLSQVVLPNGDSWHFNLNQLAQEQMTTTGQLDCVDNPDSTGSGTATGSITHPLGATVTFAEQATYQGRADVDEGCYMTFDSSGNFAGSVAMQPIGYYTMAVTSKSISNPGGTGANWSYTYSQTPGWSNKSSGADDKWVDVAGPGGGKERYWFNMRADSTDGWEEGELERADYYLHASDSNYYREVTHYNELSPFIAGASLQERRNGLRARSVIRDGGQTISQNGNTYNNLVETWDGYGDPLTTKAYSSIDPGRELDHTYTYENLPSIWWLGQTASVTDSAPADGSTPAISAESYSANYNADGTIHSVTKYGRLVGTYTWTSEGELASVTDAASNLTTLKNYYRGRPQEIDFPDGGVVSLAINPDGTIKSVKNTRGYTTTYGYDALARLDEIDYPTNDTQTWDNTIFQNPTAANLTQVSTTGSDVTTTTYDGMLRPILTQKGTSYVNSTYDGRGLLAFKSYPSTDPTSTTGTHYAYDGLGRLIQVASDQSGGTQAIETIAYEAGDKKVVTDPNGNVTTYTYDDLSGPDHSLLTEIDAPETEKTVIDYDGLGAMISATRSGLSGSSAVLESRYYAYNANRDLCAVVDPETGVTAMGYDSRGLMAWQAKGISSSSLPDPANPVCSQITAPSSDTTSYTYDSMRRLTNVTYPGTNDYISRTYDADGNVRTLSTGSTQWTYKYNGRDILTSENLGIDGLTFAITPQYNSRAQLTSLVYPTGRVIDFAADAFGRPTQVGSYVTNVNYFPNDAVQSYTYGNGDTMSMTLNTQMLPYQLDYPGSDDWTYQYDPNGNINQIDYQGPSGAPNETRTNFFYDGLNRLTSMDAPYQWGASRFTYDALDNLLSKQYGSVVQNYHYDSDNRLSTITDGSGNTLYTLGYDPQGNITQRNSDVFNFDKANRMTSSSAGGSYVYDGFGRRVKTTSSSGTATYTIYDQSGQLLEDYQPALTKYTDYAYLAGKLVAQIANQPGTAPAAGAPTIAAGDGVDGNYTISWGSVSGATSYELVQLNPAGGWTTIYQGPNLSKSVSGMLGGTYVYRVAGCTSVGCGTPGPELSVGVAPTIPAVTVPTSTQNGGYKISWTTPIDATSYSVQEYANGSWTTVASNITGTSITRPHVGGNFQYRVEASNSYGTRGYSAASVVVHVLPPAPGSFASNTAQAVDSQFTLSWAASAGASGYTLRRREESSSGTWGAWTNYPNTTSLSRSFGFRELGIGTYEFQVQAYTNGAGAGSWAGTPTVVVVWTPAIPTVTVPTTTQNGSYTVSWSAARASSYTVEEYANGSWSVMYSNTTNTSMTLPQVGGSYQFRVDAFNQYGSSGYSAASSVVNVLPPAPTGFKSSTGQSVDSEFTLTWNASAGATSYAVQGRNVNSSTWTTYSNGTSTSSSFSYHELPEGTYVFEVRAYTSGVGYGSWTGTIEVVVEWKPPTPTATVTYGQVVQGSSQYLTISWTTSSGVVKSYLQQRSMSSTGSWSAWSTTSETGTSQTYLKPSGTYGFRVQNCKGFACSAYSAEVDATVSSGSSTCSSTYSGATAGKGQGKANGSGNGKGSHSTNYLLPGC